MSKSSNLVSDLTRDYFERTSAPHGRAILREYGTPEELDDLLRDHKNPENRGISDEETVDRDAVDNLLHFYSVLEVAYRAGLITGRLPVEIEAEAYFDLRDKVVRKYYETRYRLRLLSGFRARLENGAGPAERPGIKTRNLFFRFLDLNSVVEQDHDVDAFLWFREAGVYDGHCMDTVYETLRNPESFSRIMQRRPGRDNWTGRAIVGLRKFLEFSEGLDELLDSAGRYPCLRDGFYLHHEYWYKHATYSMREILKTATIAYRGWAEKTEGIASVEEASVVHLSGVVRRLEERHVEMTAVTSAYEGAIKNLLSHGMTVIQIANKLGLTQAFIAKLIRSLNNRKTRS